MFRRGPINSCWDGSAVVYIHPANSCRVIGGRCAWFPSLPSIGNEAWWPTLPIQRLLFRRIKETSINLRSPTGTRQFKEKAMNRTAVVLISLLLTSATYPGTERSTIAPPAQALSAGFRKLGFDEEFK